MLARGTHLSIYKFASGETPSSCITGNDRKKDKCHLMDASHVLQIQKQAQSVVTQMHYRMEIALGRIAPNETFAIGASNVVMFGR